MQKLLAATPFILASALGGFVMFLILFGSLKMGPCAEMLEFSMGFVLFSFSTYAAVQTLTSKS